MAAQLGPSERETARQNQSQNTANPNVRRTKKKEKRRMPKYLFGREHSVDEKGRLQEHYKIKEKLGTGTYATVRRGVRRSDQHPVAIKIIKKRDLDELECVLVHREIEIMTRIHHRNVVKLYDLYESKHHIYLVMELCTGGELFDRVIESGSFSEEIAARVMEQIASAIAYMHERNIIHRDLKPENLLYASRQSSSVIKVTDFGLAKMVRNADDVMVTSCGTLYYVAPEILQGRSYTKAVDLWSLGVILYVLLSGSLPFYADDENETQELIKSGNLTFNGPIWETISNHAKDLVRQLLQIQPQNRPSIQNLLQHPWIASKDLVRPGVLSSQYFSRFAQYNQHRKTMSEPLQHRAQERWDRTNLSEIEDNDESKEDP